MLRSKYEQELYEVGDYIRQYRKLNKLTQEEMAEKADVSVDTIHRIENGKHKISLDMLFAVAEVLNVPVEMICQTSFENIREQEGLKKMRFLYSRLTKSNQEVVCETISALIDVLLLQQRR